MRAGDDRKVEKLESDAVLASTTTNSSISNSNEEVIMADNRLAEKVLLPPHSQVDPKAATAIIPTLEDLDEVVRAEEEEEEVCADSQTNGMQAIKDLVIKLNKVRTERAVTVTAPLLLQLM